MPEIIDNYITKENQVHFIDAFLERINTTGYKYGESKQTGRLAYNPRAEGKKLKTMNCHCEQSKAIQKKSTFFTKKLLCSCLFRIAVLRPWRSFQ
jgi:hypothetical protein